jgi:hypothetical protein
MSRATGLWALFFVLAVANAVLASRRAVPLVRAGAAWVLSTALLCAGAAALGFIGGRLTYDPYASGFVGNMSSLTGIVIGAPIGALAGAVGGIAVSERGLAGEWPRKRSLALAALSLVVIGALAWWMFALVQAREQHAGRQVFVLLPVLGLSAVLGWLWSLRAPATGAPR